MPLKKIQLRPGVNRENTPYSSENGWFDCDKIRFRQGTPEKIGGWQRISTSTFIGVCRSLWAWVTLTALKLIGVGTNKKFYIERGGVYQDVTPIRETATLTNPFTATAGSAVITVADTAHGCITGDYVTYSGAGITGLGGNITASVLTGEFVVTVINANSYTITVSALASPTDAAGSPGGGTVVAQYQINTGPEFTVPLTGWGAGPWGYGTWGYGQGATDALRLWSQNNFGQDLIFAPRGGAMYYWSASIGVTPQTTTITIASPAVVTSTTSLSNGTAIQFTTNGALPTGLSVGTVYYVVGSTGTSFNVASTYGGSAINTSGTQSGTHKIDNRGIILSKIGQPADVPAQQNYMLVSDSSRFVFAFGATELSSTVFNPMLIRWSDQGDPSYWTPSATNQAGYTYLSHGSRIVTALQARQEILAFTDSSVYSLQYVGAPVVWQNQLVGENTSIASPNAVAYANGVAYWMGIDKFYKYDGRSQTLNCDLRQYVFENINKTQFEQVCAGTNEGFNEVWWFYCSGSSDVVDSYVVYNYIEPNGSGGVGIWYYGTMARTAWLDSGLRDYPVAATYDNNLVNHENGVDDNTTGVATAIEAYISSAEFDIEDGDRFGFIWRVLPDVRFSGSTATNPSVTMSLKPMQNSGSGYNSPESVGGISSAAVIRTATIPIEKFTGQINTRVRGRQIVMEYRSTGLGVQWQAGAPRLDIRTDGRR